MFKDKFKEANDSIHADDELINKVLALKDPENRIIHRKKHIVSYIPAAAAAVLVISAAAASIPFMTKTNDDSGVIFESSVTENSGQLYDTHDTARKNGLPEDSMSNEKGSSAARPEIGSAASEPKNNVTPERGSTADQSQSSNSSKKAAVGAPDAKQNSSKKSRSTNTDTAKSSSGNSNGTSTGTAKSSSGNSNDTSTDTAKSSSGNSNGTTNNSHGNSRTDSGGSKYSEASPAEEYNLPSSKKIHSIDLPDSADSSGGANEKEEDLGILKQAAPKTAEERVVLSMNTGAYAAAYSAAMPASMPLASEIGYAEWSYRDYFDYLGRNLYPALPSDFRLTGHDTDSISDNAFLSETFEMAIDEYGTPVFDNRIFVFDGDNGRYAGIQTSLDTSTAMTYLTDSSFTLSKIGSSHGVLIGTIDDCRAYMVCGDVSYVISTRGLNEEELKTLLLSVAEQ